jgi:hypothetical protein
LDFQPRKVQGVSKLPGLGAMEWEASASPTAEAPAVDAPQSQNSLPSRIQQQDFDSTEEANGMPFRVLETETSFEPIAENCGECEVKGEYRNPGSIGHPELCTRPCLYFAEGSCTNPNECEFCHIFHPRRPARLDKRHRERLDRLSLAERVAVMQPILAQKAKIAGLSESKLQKMLGKLAISKEESLNAEKTKVSRSLKAALEAMSLRSLLQMLDCAPDVPPDL